MLCGDGVQNQIEASRGRLHAGLIGGDDEFGGAELQRRVSLGWRGRNGGNFVAHGSGETDAHLPQAADTNHADAEISLERAPMSQGGVKSDARAEDWTGCF